MKIILILTAIVAFISCGSSKNASQSNEALALTPYYLDIPTGVLFSLEAERVKIIEDEYLPTSEGLRVQILSENNTILWSSDRGINYLQAITPVEPVNKSEIYTYTVEWNGKMNNGKELPAGEYDVLLLLPAKPKPYSASLKMKWKI